MGVALIPLVIGAPLALPALLLAGGGWLSWRAWLLLMEQLTPAQQVRFLAPKISRPLGLLHGHCAGETLYMALFPKPYLVLKSDCKNELDIAISCLSV